MDTNKMREQFEAAYAAKSTARNGRFCPEVLTRGDDGEYVIPSVQSAWWAWQASRAAVVVDLPQVVAYEAGYDSLRDNEYAGLPDRLPDFDYDELFKLHRSDEVREAIEAQGLKCGVKP